MPIGSDSSSNTNMVLDVAPGGDHVVLSYPSQPQDGFGLLQFPASGVMRWLPQFVQAIVNNSDNHHSGSAVIGQDGNGQISTIDPILFNPYSQNICIGVDLRVRAYLASPSADSNAR